MTCAKTHDLRLTSDVVAPSGPSRFAPRHVGERDPFKLERRRDSRSVAAGSVVVVMRDADEGVGIMSLDLVDRSARGLGVTSPVPLAPGTHVTLCPQGTPHVWISMLAVRCIARPDGTYHAGLRYTTPTAA